MRRVIACNWWQYRNRAANRAAIAQDWPAGIAAAAPAAVIGQAEYKEQQGMQGGWWVGLLEGM